MGAGRDVSVVIPYYNREEYIDETIQSVLAQTLPPLEIIIVNDCSRERSRRFLDRYASVCTIIDLTTNVGLAGARNVGIKAARGQFIAFLDDDDLWLPRKLEVQRKYMDEHPECEFLHTPAWFFFQNERENLFKQFGPGPMLLAQALTNGYCALVPTILARAEAVRAVNGFDIKFREVEDRDFIVRCCAAGYRVVGIEEPLVRVRRQKQDGLTQAHWRIYRADLRMCWKHRDLYMQAFGLRGILSFIIEKAQAPARETWFLDGLLLFLLKFVQYDPRKDYRDPVLNHRRQPSLKAIHPETHLAGNSSL